jgi:hypothetical protein
MQLIGLRKHIVFSQHISSSDSRRDTHVSKFFLYYEFKQVYRERNVEADTLSKFGLLLHHGQWHIKEQRGEDTYEYYHRLLLNTFKSQLSKVRFLSEKFMMYMVHYMSKNCSL